MPQHARLSYLVRQAQLATYQQLDQALRGFGLTPTQYTVLAILSRRGESLSSAALAPRRLGCSAASPRTRSSRRSAPGNWCAAPMPSTAAPDGCS